MALDASLQLPFETIFADLIASAAQEGRGEVGWLERFHREAGEMLAQKLREAMREKEIWDSVSAQSAFIHGNPFQIEAVKPLTRGVEAGDLLLVSERFEGDRVVERQALLLQMKIGPPDLNASSTLQQALLYGAWPSVEWRAKALRELPGPHPRHPDPGPCDAAQFGVIPAAEGGAFAAQRLIGPGVFAPEPGPLAAPMAAVTRLDIGIDASPGPLDGWSRIVQDMLDRSLELDYGGRLPRHYGAIPAQRGADDSAGGFVVVVVSTGPTGLLD